MNPDRSRANLKAVVKFTRGELDEAGQRELDGYLERIGRSASKDKYDVTIHVCAIMLAEKDLGWVPVDGWGSAWTKRATAIQEWERTLWANHGIGVKRRGEH